MHVHLMWGQSIAMAMVKPPRAVSAQMCSARQKAGKLPRAQYAPQLHQNTQPAAAKHRLKAQALVARHILQMPQATASCAQAIEALQKQHRGQEKKSSTGYKEGQMPTSPSKA
jgi:hypothetical protein